MTIRRASVMLPARELDDFPTHLTGEAAADLLAAWTAVWHPALLHATQQLPAWHPAGEPPDPAALEGELVVIPSASRQQMTADWIERVRATSPRNPMPVESKASRAETVDVILKSAGMQSNDDSGDTLADFFALGFAHLQVGLLTRAMRYSSVLDEEQFLSAVLAAAGAAVAGNREQEREELGRAFDLLADERNHIYSVDFYVTDLTLVANTTLGDLLRAKLATGSPTNLLITGQQLEQLAAEHPDTLVELKSRMDAGTTSIVGGTYSDSRNANQSPETILEDLSKGQEVARRILGREFEVFGQFSSDFSPLLPAILKNLGFVGALHAAFDGGNLPRADQRKTNWSAANGPTIQALSTTPLDVSRPETWLKLAERMGDSIAHDHVATILLAGWPGTACEYFDDVRRAARYGSVLGRLVTLEEYFRETREPDDWTKFVPKEPAPSVTSEPASAPISSRVAVYRSSVRATQRQLAAGLAAIAGFSAAGADAAASQNAVVVNPWNFAHTQIVGGNILPLPLGEGRGEGVFKTSDVPSPNPLPRGEGVQTPTLSYLPDVPGCGFATLASAALPPRVALAERAMLRNEWMELTVSKTTGGIQSLRRHRDRNTRVSQRLVFHHQTGTEPAESRMVADKVEITRNEQLIGEIRSRGRILGAGREVLARYTQRVRAIRGMPAMIVEVDLEPEVLPKGTMWKSYFASRLAWADDAMTIRRGKQWTGGEASNEFIDSPEWVEIDDANGKITCFGLGLPFHRALNPTRVDTLLLIDGESERKFQFALGLDLIYPTHSALALLSASEPSIFTSPGALSTPQGWFLHIGAKNALCTHIEPLQQPASGVRLRILETEGRETQTTLAAFRPFQAAWATDFRGNRTHVLSITDGRAELELTPYGWVQIEAEW